MNYESFTVAVYECCGHESELDGYDSGDTIESRSLLCPNCDTDNPDVHAERRFRPRL